MRDKRTGEISYGYGRRERVEHVGTMLPHGAPSEYADPECCLCSMVLRPVERLVFSPKER